MRTNSFVLKFDEPEISTETDLYFLADLLGSYLAKLITDTSAGVGEALSMRVVLSLYIKLTGDSPTHWKTIFTIINPAAGGMYLSGSPPSGIIPLYLNSIHTIIPQFGGFSSYERVWGNISSTFVIP